MLLFLDELSQKMKKADKSVSLSKNIFFFIEILHGVNMYTCNALWR
jgi:hypothetical protein